MYSNTTCALSGAFLLAGGWAVVMWIFMRSLSLHLQICWQMVPGVKFFYGALTAGWGIPAIMLAIALSITGVSYRFGDTCHINHTNSLQDFWGPLLAFAAAATVIQLATFGYCIQVYLRSLLDDSPTTDNSSALPSYSGSLRTVSAAQAYRRVRRVVHLQWRGIAIAILIIVNVAFFAIVFVYMDNTTQWDPKDIAKAQPWILCLMENGGDKNKCLDLAAHLVVSEATVMAVLIMLSMNGIWCLLLLGRWSMVTGWIEFIRNSFDHPREFVSVDARRMSTNPRTYEMLSSPPQTQAELKTPEPLVLSPGSIDDVEANQQGVTTFSPITGKGKEPPDYFGREARYSSPPSSFSTPKVPISVTAAREWDPRLTHARGTVWPGTVDFSKI
ncbi:MAG: hypothetical protein M1812_002955 [Candelaria pacifica]|nr:MAG: hypothetical protein M1812_002955 [Candelaria pacifica]